MTPNHRTKLFLNLREHLKAANLQFFERATERQFLLMMRAEEMTFAQLVTVRPDGVSIRVETKIATLAPAHRRVAAAELVARLNRLSDRGHYDLDVDSGEICFRIDAHALGSVLMPGLLVRLLAMALQAPVRDIPVLDAVLLRDADPADSIKQNAERIARAAESAARASKALRGPDRATRKRRAKDNLRQITEAVDEILREKEARRRKAAEDAARQDPEKEGPAPDPGTTPPQE
jgi:hypothetical protein